MITEQTARQALPAHIVRRLNFDSDCWLFTGPLRPDGYARVSVSKYRMQYLHILSWNKIIGDIPQGLTLDHLVCRNRSCCNPNHMEVVTRAENIRRGEVGKNSYSKTHCPRGHTYNTANTHIDKTRRRHCRACAREKARERASASK